jgi:hypothetical protein
MQKTAQHGAISSFAWMKKNLSIATGVRTKRKIAPTAQTKGAKTLRRKK